MTLVHNPDYADGLATSLKAGLAAVPESAGGALVAARRHAGRDHVP